MNDKHDEVNDDDDSSLLLSFRTGLTSTASMRGVNFVNCFYTESWDAKLRTAITKR